MTIIYSGITDIGQKRQINQDAILTFAKEEQKMYLFVVADGMGAHVHGELASGTITNELYQWAVAFQEQQYGNDFQKMMTALQCKIRDINQFIFKEYNQSQVCGATGIVLFIYRDVYGVISAGDSRIYLHRFLKTQSLMTDDTWENQSTVRDSLSKKQMFTHPNFGKLVNAIGSCEDVSLSVKTDSLKKGDTFLICSDGLYKYCPEKFFMKNMKGISKNNIQDALRKMIGKTYKQGAKDNISAILVKCVK